MSNSYGHSPQRNSAYEKPINFGTYPFMLYLSGNNLCIAMSEFKNKKDYKRKPLRYLRHCLKNPRQMGSVTASSRFLARKMVKHVDFEQAEVIVELGGGDGAITREIFKHKKPHTKLIIIEKNEKLAAHLRLKFPDAEVINDDAAHLAILIEEHGGKIDYVISGLPFACFSQEIRIKIFAQVEKILQKNGLFIAFQYSKILDKDFREYFEITDLGFTLFNLPPAFVYNCAKK